MAQQPPGPSVERIGGDDVSVAHLTTFPSTSSTPTYTPSYGADVKLDSELATSSPFRGT